MLGAVQLATDPGFLPLLVLTLLSLARYVYVCPAVEGRPRGSNLHATNPILTLPFVAADVALLLTVIGCDG